MRSAMIMTAMLTAALSACSPTPETAAVQAGRAEPEARPPRPPVPPVRVEISETPCRQAIGEAASAKLVKRCIAVSPATHPPCHAANPCDLIQGEIDRACNQYAEGETRPRECAA